MTSRERIQKAINHQIPDKVPLDVGSTSVTGIHASAYAKLKNLLDIRTGEIKVVDPFRKREGGNPYHGLKPGGGAARRLILRAKVRGYSKTLKIDLKGVIMSLCSLDTMKMSDDAQRFVPRTALSANASCSVMHRRTGMSAVRVFSEEVS